MTACVRLDLIHRRLVAVHGVAHGAIPGATGRLTRYATTSFHRPVCAHVIWSACISVSPPLRYRTSGRSYAGTGHSPPAHSIHGPKTTLRPYSDNAIMHPLRYNRPLRALACQDQEGRGSQRKPHLPHERRDTSDIPRQRPELPRTPRTSERLSDSTGNTHGQGTGRACSPRIGNDRHCAPRAACGRTRRDRLRGTRSWHRLPTRQQRRSMNRSRNVPHQIARRI
jgi:hypothetical protein